jgi:hypothetical protein
LCEALARELGKVVRRLDVIAAARGGDDEFTRLARRGLSIVKQAVTKMRNGMKRYLAELDSGLFKDLEFRLDGGSDERESFGLGCAP